MRLKKTFALTLCLLMLIGSSMTAFAAPKKSSKAAAEAAATNAALATIFDANYYGKTYSDVKAVCGDDATALFAHFVTYGVYDGRQPNSAFNVFAYKCSYADLAAAFGNNLPAYYVHYATLGKNEGRTLTTLNTAAKAGFTVTDLNGKVLYSPKDVARVEEANPNAGKHRHDYNYIGGMQHKCSTCSDVQSCYFLNPVGDHYICMVCRGNNNCVDSNGDFLCDVCGAALLNYIYVDNGDGTHTEMTNYYYD